MIVDEYRYVGRNEFALQRKRFVSVVVQMSRRRWRFFYCVRSGLTPGGRWVQFPRRGLENRFPVDRGEPGRLGEEYLRGEDDRGW